MQPTSLKVAKTTKPDALARALCKWAESGLDEIEVSCLGALATYMALRGVARANELTPVGEIVAVPHLEHREMIYPTYPGEERELIVLTLRKQVRDGR